MKVPLRILHLEDDPVDVELVQSKLASEGIPCATTCVQTRAEFLSALQRGGFDLILSDFSLPGLDGLSALRMAHAESPDLPVILVSGTMGEDRAIDSLKSGATDYVLKGHLARLAPAVRRAMQEVEDRAERRRLEAQVIETQKMEVVGQLACGVAHDFNNILAVIMGYSELIMAELEPDGPLRRYVEAIRMASERAALLTRQLLVFSRKQTAQPVVLDLNDVVKDLHELLQRLIDENIELTILPGKQIGRIKADAGYIGQVLMNLVVNARDAMPGGGKLTIGTSHATLDETCMSAHQDAAPGDYVMLSVSDTGVGMTADVKAHLFEAFFTTKPKGKGTGLGLTTCHAIVQQFGGHIEVHSQLGKGTTFEIYFPRVEQPLDWVARKIPPGPLPQGTETLLVVEDEQSVRHLVQAVLETQGYEVLSASNGEDALREVRKHTGAPIRLVVTDVIMPLMGGKVMAEWLKTSYPDLKILFTSGYEADALALDCELRPCVDFLPKPYTPAVLIHKVREMLDETETAFLRKLAVPIHHRLPD